jgi:hypothetical protein
MPFPDHKVQHLDQLRVALIAQKQFLKGLEHKVSLINESLQKSDGDAEALIELDQMLSSIEDRASLLSSEDLNHWTAAEIQDVYEAESQNVSFATKHLEFSSWTQFCTDSMAYCEEIGLDVTLPYDALLSEADLQDIKEDVYQAQFRWDKWDYIFVGFAGVVAAVIDCLVVGIPQDITSGRYRGQKGSDLTAWLKKFKLPENLQKWLELNSKAPFDQTGGANHRIDTPGHDPVLGFIFGVLDICRGTSTTWKGGNAASETAQQFSGQGLTEALIKQFIHLMSDAFTSKGLPVPFASAFRLLNVGQFTRSNGRTASISDLALWMYHHGYDLRHFLTMSTVPASIEVILRAYIMIRQYVEGEDLKFLLAGNPKYRSMLLSAHAIACASNAGKIYLAAGNPLAINYAEWLACLRYFMPSIKYWLFDKQRIRLDQFEQIADCEWDRVLQSSEGLLKASIQRHHKIVALGMQGRDNCS